MAQRFDHAWLIYKRVIEETIKNSATLQSEAVLRELKNKWLQHLAAQIQAQQNGSVGHKPVKEDVKKVKAESILDDLDTGHSAKVPDPSPTAWKSVNQDLVRDSDVPQHDAISTTEWTGQRPTAALPSTSAQPTNPIDLTNDSSEEVDVPSGDDAGDDWDDWEDPEQIEEKQKIAKKGGEKRATRAPSPPAVTAASQLDEALSLNPAIPRDDDFTTTLRTQYGTTIIGAGENPDEVNSDLDEISSLSDEEPEAQDYIIGQCEEVRGGQ